MYFINLLEESIKRIPRRIFTAEFKREAIKLVTEQGLTLAEASKKLGVAKSCYPAWSTGKVVSPRKLEDIRLLVAIKAAHQKGRGTYGPKKILDELAGQGIVAGLNRIKRLRMLASAARIKINSESPPTTSTICRSLRIY